MPTGRLASDDEVRRLAAELLAGKDYARYRIDEAAWRAFFERLSRGLDTLLAWFEGLRVDSPLVYWAVLAALTLVALLLLAHVAWSIHAALHASAPRRPLREGPPRRDLAEEAARLASAGCFLEAARRLEHACLHELLASGTIELARGDANRVLRRQLADATLPDPHRRELLALLDRLEARLFRDPAEDAELYQGWRRFHARLHARSAA